MPRCLVFSQYCIKAWTTIISFNPPNKLTGQLPLLKMRKSRLREIKQAFSGSLAQGEVEPSCTHWGLTWKASEHAVAGRGVRAGSTRPPDLGRPGFQICHLVELFYRLLLCASNPPSVNWGEIQSLPTAMPLATITAFKNHQRSA